MGGVVIEILALPLAPFRGIGWVLDKVVSVAEEEYYDPVPVHEALVDLEKAREENRIDDEDFARNEEALLQRLEEIAAYQRRRGGQRGL